MAPVGRPPRTWQEWRAQLLVAVVVCAVLLLVLSLWANDTPWTQLLIGLPLIVAVSAVSTALRIRHDRKAHH